MHKNLSSIKKVVYRQLIQKSFSFLIPFMLNNYRFLLQPPQNETQQQSRFFFLFFKTVIVYLAFP